MAGDGATTMLAQARNALFQGEFAQAAQIAERVGRADPQTAEAWFVLGMALAETGLVVAISTLHRFFERHGVTRKKRRRTPSSKTAPTF